MNEAIRIRPLLSEEMDAVLRLRSAAILGINLPQYPPVEVQRWAAVDTRQRLLSQSRRCGVQVAKQGRNLLGFVSLAFEDHPDDQQGRQLVVDQLFVDPDQKGQGLGRQLLVAAEARAAQLGATDLQVEASLNAVDFYRHHGYQLLDQDTSAFRCQRANLPAQLLAKDLSPLHSSEQQRILACLESLGIDSRYGCAHALPLVPECQALQSIGEDVFGRDQRMLTEAATAWQRMRKAAKANGIELQPVSAFRSIDYQAGLVQRKLDAGQPLERILAVSAAPGFSEHHSGRALDITTPGSKPLEQEFEQTAAFEWLQQHAAEFGFHLSYPRDNPHNIAYEPWHWCWHPSSL